VTCLWLHRIILTCNMIPTQRQLPTLCKRHARSGFSTRWDKKKRFNYIITNGTIYRNKNEMVL